MDQRGVALFDFDGTITRSDSFKSFIRFMKGKRKMITGFIRLLPWIAGYKTGVIPNDRAKERVLIHFFRNMEEKEFQAQAKTFAKEVLTAIENKAAMNKIEWHKKRGDRVIVVSASIEYYLIPWCRFNQVEAVGTKLRVVNGRITGEIEGENCYGHEKINRIRRLLDLSEYSPVYAYGDTTGDFPMLALADHAFYREF